MLLYCIGGGGGGGSLLYCMGGGGTLHSSSIQDGQWDTSKHRCT